MNLLRRVWGRLMLWLVVAPAIRADLDQFRQESAVDQDRRLAAAGATAKDRVLGAEVAKGCVRPGSDAEGVR